MTSIKVESSPCNSQDSSPQTELSSQFLPYHNSYKAPNGSRIRHLSLGEERLVAVCKKLRRTNVRLKTKLRKVKEDIRQAKAATLKRLEQLRRDPDAFVGLFSDLLSPMALLLLKSQILVSRKVPHERRWDNEVKVLASSIYKMTPPCYNLLRTMFSLPTKLTVISFMNQSPFLAGINSQVFSSLNNSLEHLGGSATLCSLIFDKLPVAEYLRFDPSMDLIVGYEDLGNGHRTSTCNDQVFVFIAQGLIHKWKQPFAYYFVKNGMEATTLVHLIREVVTTCFSAHINVEVLVCDMNLLNIEALSLLGSNEERPYFTHDGKRIVTIFNPPHLLISTRNMFLNHDIRVPVDVSRLTVLYILHTNKPTGLLLCYKLFV